MKLTRMAKLRQLCIHHNLFTCGDDDAYVKLLNAFGDRTATTAQIAAMIWVNSNTDLTLSNITELILNLEGQL